MKKEKCNSLYCYHFLETAIKNEDRPMVMNTINGGVDKNIKNSYGNNVLFLAISYSVHLDFFKFLVEEVKIDTTAVNIHGQNLLDAAKMFSTKSDIIKYLEELEVEK